MTTTKHPDTIAWEKWRDSVAGRNAVDRSPLRIKDHEQFMRFWLEAAFQAGVKFGREGK